MREAPGYVGIVDGGQHGAIHEVCVAHEPLHLPALERVEPTEGIVKNQHLRVMEERSRHQQPLAMPGRERVERCLAGGDEPRHLQRPRDRLTERFAPQASGHADQLQKLSGPQPRPGGEPVGHVADGSPHPLGLPPHRAAVDEDLAGVQGHRGGDGGEQRALARSGPAHDGRRLPRRHGERDRLDDDPSGPLDGGAFAADHPHLGVRSHGRRRAARWSSRSRRACPSPC